MNGFLDNEVVQGVISALGAVLILGLFGWLKFKRDEKVVSQLLGKSGLGLSRMDRKIRVIPKTTGGAERQMKKGRGKSSRIKKRDINGG